MLHEVPNLCLKVRSNSVISSQQKIDAKQFLVPLLAICQGSKMVLPWAAQPARFMCTTAGVPDARMMLISAA